MALLLLFGDVLLFEDLHRIVFAVIFFFDQNHFGIGTFADDADCEEGFQINLFLDALITRLRYQIHL